MNQTSEISNNPLNFMPRSSSTPLPVPQKVVDQQISNQLLKEGQKILNKFKQRRFSDPSLSWDDEDMKSREPEYENTRNMTIEEEENRGEKEKTQRLQEIDNLIARQTASLVTSKYSLRPRDQLKLPDRYKL